MPFNYARLSQKIDKIMRRFGRQPGTTFLRRAGVDREVVALEEKFSPREIDGVIVLRDDVRYLISVVDLESAPDHKLDRLVLLDEDSVETEYLFVEKPERLQPGNTNILWLCHARRP